MNIFSRSEKLMGNQFTFTVVALHHAQAMEYIDLAIAEINRIEQLLSTYQDSSQTNQINTMAGISPVEVTPEVYQLIERSLAISKITQGAFDITYGSIDKKLWNFDKSMTKLPDRQMAKRMVHLVDYRNIILDPLKHTVFLKHTGMRIGFGGIGKGYAADMAKKILVDQGVQAGIINASGDLCTWGMQPDGTPWTIGIAHPDSPAQPFSYMNISDKAMATSGNYEKYVWIDGKKYAHTIDPKTGLPVHGVKSVTMIARSAELADAMATPISIMGIHAGMHLIDQLPDLEGIVIDEKNTIYTSKNVRLL